MDLRLLYAILLTILPGTELRFGLPIAILYAKDYGIPLILIFLLIVLVNVLLIFFVFFFFDNLHKGLLHFKFYKKFFDLYLKKVHKRVAKFEKRYKSIGFLALVLFVAVPLPGTGAWTGGIVSWLLNLNRKKSIFAIALGVLIAGLLIFLGTIGFISLFL